MEISLIYNMFCLFADGFHVHVAVPLTVKSTQVFWQEQDMGYQVLS